MQAVNDDRGERWYQHSTKLLLVPYVVTACKNAGLNTTRWGTRMRQARVQRLRQNSSLQRSRIQADSDRYTSVERRNTRYLVRWERKRKRERMKRGTRCPVGSAWALSRGFARLLRRPSLEAATICHRPPSPPRLHSPFPHPSPPPSLLSKEKQSRRGDEGDCGIG